jgi:hypothetical protein
MLPSSRKSVEPEMTTKAAPNYRTPKAVAISSIDDKLRKPRVIGLALHGIESLFDDYVDQHLFGGFVIRAGL